MDSQHLLLPDESLPAAPQSHTGLVVIELAKRHRPGRGRWWKPDRAGYTNCPGLVGIYTAAEAAEICVSGESYAVDAADLLALAEESAALLKLRIDGRAEQKKISEYHCGLCYQPRFRCECPVT